MTLNELSGRVQSRLIRHGWPSRNPSLQRSAEAVIAKWKRTAKARRGSPEEFTTRYVRHLLKGKDW